MKCLKLYYHYVEGIFSRSVEEQQLLPTTPLHLPSALNLLPALHLHSALLLYLHCLPPYHLLHLFRLYHLHLHHLPCQLNRLPIATPCLSLILIPLFSCHLSLILHVPLHPIIVFHHFMTHILTTFTINLLPTILILQQFLHNPSHRLSRSIIKQYSSSSVITLYHFRSPILSICNFPH